MKDNIGTLNEIFIQNVGKTFASKDNSRLIKEYYELIKSNKSLLKEYLVFNCIENKKKDENVKDYIKESISYLDNIDKSELLKLNDKVSEFLNKNGITKISEIKNEKLYENIDKLIFYKKSIKNINEKVESLNNIANYINENNINEDKPQIIEDVDTFYKLAVLNFNKKYSGKLNEEEKAIFKSVTSKKTEDEKNGLFEEKRKECLTLTNKFLNESLDLVTKEKLLNVKEKLLEQKYSKDLYIKDLISFVELKKTLSD